MNLNALDFILIVLMLLFVSLPLGGFAADSAHDDTPT